VAGKLEQRLWWPRRKPEMRSRQRLTNRHHSHLNHTPFALIFLAYHLLGTSSVRLDCWILTPGSSWNVYCSALISFVKSDFCVDLDVLLLRFCTGKCSWCLRAAFGTAGSSSYLSPSTGAYEHSSSTRLPRKTRLHRVRRRIESVGMQWFFSYIRVNSTCKTLRLLSKSLLLVE